MENQSEMMKLIIRFTQGADELNALVKGLTEKDLDLRLGAGEWTIRQIIHHLADDGDFYSFTVKRALVTPGCKITFGGFPGNEVWSDELKNETRTIRADLDLIIAHRVAIAELISVFPERLDYTVTFIGDKGKEAKMSVWQIIQILSDHMTEHLTTIKKIKATHNIRR